MLDVTVCPPWLCVRFRGLVYALANGMRERVRVCLFSVSDIHQRLDGWGLHERTLSSGGGLGRVCQMFR